MGIALGILLATKGNNVNMNIKNNNYIEELEISVNVKAFNILENSLVDIVYQVLFKILSSNSVVKTLLSL